MRMSLDGNTDRHLQYLFYKEKTVKVSPTFQISIFFMAVLILSTPFTTLAEESAVAAEAKAQAIRDAENDFNKPLWFLAGCAIPTISIVGMYAGCFIGHLLDPIELDYDSASGYSITGGNFIGPGMCVGFTIGGLMPYIAISRYSLSTPHLERLIGKSPEYIQVYTNVYQAKMQRFQKGWAIAGAATGYTLLAVYYGATFLLIQ